MAFASIAESRGRFPILLNVESSAVSMICSFFMLGGPFRGYVTLRFKFITFLLYRGYSTVAFLFLLGCFCPHRPLVETLTPTCNMG